MTPVRPASEAVQLVVPPRGSGVAFVTGAAGFLGCAVAEAFAAAGWRVAGFGYAPEAAGDSVRLKRLALWREGEIASGSLAEASRQLGRPEIVFHAAGGASVGGSIADPERDRRWTIGSLLETLAFLEAEAPGARLIYPSSAAVYGSDHPGPIGEDDALTPISPYGRHKLQAEHLIAEATDRFGLDAVIIRFFSLYGPGLRKQLPWELAGRLLQAPGEVMLSGSGEEVRDFLFIDDAVRLIGRLAGLPRQTRPMILNGGGGRGVTVRGLAEALAGAMGRPRRIGFSGEARPGDPASLLADPARARALGFEPTIGLDEGLSRLAAWVREETATAAE